MASPHNWRELVLVPGLQLPFGVDHVDITHAVHLEQFERRPGRLLGRMLSAANAAGMSWIEHVTDDQNQMILDFDAADFPWLYERFEAAILDVNDAHFGLDLTYWHPMRLNRYRAGMTIGHRGHSDYQAPEPAKLAFSLILEAADEGGAMTVDNYGPAVNLAAGDMLVFPAYEQHWVDPVTVGERVSLTGWLGGPPLR